MLFFVLCREFLENFNSIELVMKHVFSRESHNDKSNWAFFNSKNLLWPVYSWLSAADKAMLNSYLAILRNTERKVKDFLFFPTLPWKTASSNWWLCSTSKFLNQLFFKENEITNCWSFSGHGTTLISKNTRFSQERGSMFQTHFNQFISYAPIKPGFFLISKFLKVLFKSIFSFPRSFLWTWSFFFSRLTMQILLLLTIV